MPGDFQNPTGKESEQLLEIDSALSREVVGDDLQQSFPTSAVIMEK